MCFQMKPLRFSLSEKIPTDHIIKFAFDMAEDLIKIGENPIVFDNENSELKLILDDSFPEKTKFIESVETRLTELKEEHKDDNPIFG